MMSLGTRMDLEERGQLIKPQQNLSLDMGCSQNKTSLGQGSFLLLREISREGLSFHYSAKFSSTKTLFYMNVGVFKTSVYYLKFSIIFIINNVTLNIERTQKISSIINNENVVCRFFFAADDIDGL